MGTLLLKRKDVATLLTIEECIAGVEHAFKLQGLGKALPPTISGMHLPQGGFHVKAGVLENYFVAKINGNFPENSKRNGLPTIQGIIAVCDAENGSLLALIDSIEITIIRTGAATAVAAKYLSSPPSKTVTICGCGNQGRISLQALRKVRPITTAFAFDIDESIAHRFSFEFSTELNITPISKGQLASALKRSEIVVTCTPSKQPFIRAEDIAPGTFIAAVGADSEEKQELFADLVAASKIVVDVAKQSATIGELHHAIDAKNITMDGIHAELGMIVACKKPGRQSEDEIILFDSTGMALQDVAAASIVYEKALQKQMGTEFDFAHSVINNSMNLVLKNERQVRALKSWFPFR